MYIWTIKGNLVFIVWFISTETLQFLSIRKKCVVKNSRWELKVPGRQPRERVNTFSEKVPFHENRLFRKKYCSMKGVLYFFKKSTFSWKRVNTFSWKKVDTFSRKYFFLKKIWRLFQENTFSWRKVITFSRKYFFLKKFEYFFRRILFHKENWILFQENTFPKRTLNTFSGKYLFMKEFCCLQLSLLL